MEDKTTSQLTSKSQVTVPKKIREALGLYPKGKVTFVLRDSGRVELQAAPDLLDLAGKYTKKIKLKDASKLREQMEKETYTRA